MTVNFIKLILEFVYKDSNNEFDLIVFNSRYIIKTIKNKPKKKYKNTRKTLINNKEIQRLKNAVFYVFNKNTKKLFSIN